jgi:hypothetical protein
LVTATRNTCNPCVANCKDCLNGTQCTACLDKFVVNETNTCSPCASNHFKENSTTCSNCPLNCAACSNATSCDTCEPTHPVWNPAISECLVRLQTDTILALAALTFTLSLIRRKSGVDLTYRINFSDGIIILASPLTFTELNSWVNISLKDYQKHIHYEYTLTYNQVIQSIDVDLKLKESIKDTTITATINDKSKIKTASGKILQNSESQIDFDSHTIQTENLTGLMSFIKGLNIGNSLTSVGLAGAFLSATMGNSFSFFAKFILIIEFLGMI